MIPSRFGFAIIFSVPLFSSIVVFLVYKLLLLVVSEIHVFTHKYEVKMAAALIASVAEPHTQPMMPPRSLVLGPLFYYYFIILDEKEDYF